MSVEGKSSLFIVFSPKSGKCDDLQSMVCDTGVKGAEKGQISSNQAP
jgi:hypothetical protein